MIGTVIITNKKVSHSDNAHTHDSCPYSLVYYIVFFIAYKNPYPIAVLARKNPYPIHIPARKSVCMSLSSHTKIRSSYFIIPYPCTQPGEILVRTCKILVHARRKNWIRAVFLHTSRKCWICSVFTRTQKISSHSWKRSPIRRRQK